MVSTLTLPHLTDILQESFHDASIRVLSVDVKAACNAGEGYMSLVDRVFMRVSGREGETQTLSVVVKSLPRNQQRRVMFHSDRAFANEVAAYRHIVPVLYCQTLGGTSPFTRLLYSRVQGETDDVLVLEDLIPLNFRPAERRRGLDVAHCCLVAQELARFHARSLVTKVLCPEMFKAARHALTEVIFFPGAVNSFGLSIDNSIKMASDALRVDDPALADALEKLLVSHVDSMHTTKGQNGSSGQNNCSLGSERRFVFCRLMELMQAHEPYSVIHHGDFHASNLFFSYQPDSSVSSMKILDLQIMRYGSPLIDILHFVTTNCANPEENLQIATDRFLVHYHQELERVLVRFGLGPTNHNGSNICPTLSWLQQEAGRLTLYSLAIGLMLLPAVTLPSEHAVDLESMDKQDFHSERHVASLTAKLPSEYTRRARLIVQEAVRHGLL